MDLTEKMKKLPESILNFKKSYDAMVGTSDAAYKKSPIRQIVADSNTTDQIRKIIKDGSYEEVLTLSQNYRVSSGLYQRILLYFSNLLTYDVYVAPKKVTSKSIKQKNYLENYRAATYYTDTVINPKSNFPKMMFKLLQDGAYYGLFMVSDDYHVIFKELPSKYCRTRFKSYNDNNILEFDMSYFNTITDSEIKKTSLAEFGKDFTKAYSAYLKDSVNSRWFVVPEEMGVAFYFIDSLKPLFLSTIAAIAELNEYKAIEKDLDTQALERILIQKIPMDKEGSFLLDPQEAAELHKGVSKMLANHEYVDVLTTFAEVTTETLGERAKNQIDNLQKVERSVYTESGLSQEVFDSTSSQSLPTSILSDMAVVIAIIKQFDNWMNYQINIKFSEKGKYFFEACTLPITHYNRKEILSDYLKNAEFGYSKILPAVASGMKQSSFLDMMELENTMLNLSEALIPLQSSHTTSAADSSGGAPTKSVEDKSPKTIQNQEG